MQFAPVPDNLLLRAASGRRPKDGRLRHLAFEAGDQLWIPGSAISYALFPLSGVISLQLSAGRGKQCDVGMVGPEGFAEVPYFLGAKHASMTAIALTAGEAVAMPPELFLAYRKNVRFREATDRYARAFFVMLSRIAVCNRLHVIEKTVVGRLLLMQDRTHTDSFQLTQDFYARVLGVRKATVSRAANSLLELGAIRYDRRGHLTIVDRRKLESQACSCYRAIKAESDSLVAALGGF
jgi:CRP-like cAMP-binding protein